MKESVLDVLMYLFENYRDAEVTDAAQHEALREELEGAGFPEDEIEHALEWLDGLAEQRRQLALFGTRSTLRIYTRQEQARLSTDARGFLLYLEQIGTLTPSLRELAIDRMMALEDEVDLERAKWVLLLVLMNQPGGEAAYNQLEELVSYDGEFLH